MNKLGYFLVVLGFAWMTFVAAEVGPVARSTSFQYRQKWAGQQPYTREEIVAAYSEGAYRIARFARMGLVGSLLMLAGGIILRRNSASKKPPILSNQNDSQVANNQK